MLSQQVLTAVVAVEKQIYLALTEVEELTGELARRWSARTRCPYGCSSPCGRRRWTGSQSKKLCCAGSAPSAP